MSAAVYLLGHRLKNRLLAMLKNPGSLLGMLVMAALLVVVLVSGNMGAAHTEAFRDQSELYALVLLLYAVIFVLVTKNGLNKGTSLFSMADVNLLFTAPVSNRRVLLYGLVQQMGTSLLMGAFLLFQYAWMHQTYGIRIAFLLAVMLGYALTMFCGQLTAMALYVYTSGSDSRKRSVTWILVALCVAAAAYVVVRTATGTDGLIASAVAAATGLPLSLFPVGGWLRAMVVAFDTGSWLIALAALGAVALYVLLMTRWITSTQSDYYEDVLRATERSFSAIVAAKDGVAAEVLPENIRAGKLGLGGGLGASAFYYKQRLESRRARRFLLDPMTLIMLAVTLVFAFLLRAEGMLPALIFATYMQFFSISTGRWARELLLPYIYLVPEKPFRKLLFCLMETAQKQLVEAVLLAVGMMLIFDLPVAEVLGLVLFRFSFSMLFLGAMLLIERLFSGLQVKWLVMVLMLVTMLLLSIPGIVLGVLGTMGAWLPGTLAMTLLPAAANLPLALLLVFASRNMLQTAELNR